MRLIAEPAARVTSNSFKRKYIALGRIVKNWREIAGDQLYRKAQPVKIHYRKAKKGRGADIQEIQLTIAVSNADATLMHYQKDVILERINRIFGKQWITSIRFVSSPRKLDNSTNFLRENPEPLTKQEQSVLSGMLGTVHDDHIRQRLAQFGQYIIVENRSKL